MRLDRDLEGILAIDRASFTNPWSREMYEWEARNSDVTRVFVLRGRGREVVGYCAGWLIFDELHINNLAVAPEWRRRGLGSFLVRAVLARAAAEGALRATLEVRASNLAARRLYEALGFVQAGIRHGYYTNPPEDALILWREARPGGPQGPGAPGFA
jgi:ribosomal-protein-alanine N-acetyltransferase